MSIISPKEARNIAAAVVEHERHRRWFDEDIVGKLASAAEFKTLDAAADAMDMVLADCSRTVPYDDPHDAMDTRRMT